MGTNALASGRGDSAIGAGARVLADQGSAFGTGATVGAGHTNSTAVGAGATTTNDNQVMLGTSSTTTTAPGITSAQSRQRQSGPVEIVTSVISPPTADRPSLSLPRSTRNCQPSTTGSTD